ncbi:hypothetical protein Tco_1026650 [Tanacetum coccineum]
MTEPTLEEHVNKTRGDYYSGITKMMINGKDAYELKGKFLDDLPNNAFSGTNGEDAVEHIENFLKIVDPLDLPNKKGDDHEVLTNEAFSNPEETYKDGEHKIAKIFRIETGIFDFEIPLCTTFNEFNYLLKIDTDLFTHDIQEAKTYEEYKNELNNDPEEPWLENEVPYELINHVCEPFHFKNGKTKWPTCSSSEDGFCNGRELQRIVRVSYMTYFQDCEWYDDLVDGKLKEEALKQKIHLRKLDYELLVKLEEYWWKMNDHKCSPFTNWRNHIHDTYANTKIDANYNPYLDVSRTFNNHAERNDEEAIREERSTYNTNVRGKKQEKASVENVEVEVVVVKVEVIMAMVGEEVPWPKEVEVDLPNVLWIRKKV